MPFRKLFLRNRRANQLVVVRLVEYSGITLKTLVQVERRQHCAYGQAQDCDRWWRRRAGATVRIMGAETIGGRRNSCSSKATVGTGGR